MSVFNGVGPVGGETDTREAEREKMKNSTSNSELESNGGETVVIVSEDNYYDDKDLSNAQDSVTDERNKKDNSVQPMSDIDSFSKRPRKKRKTFSCAVCRKFKTRCGFEPSVGKCHRCNSLGIECSLTKDREDEILAVIEDSSKSTVLSHNAISSITTNIPLDSSSDLFTKNKNEPVVSTNPLTHTLNNRLNRFEEKFNSLESKIELILMLMQGSSSAAEIARETIPSKSNDIPTNLEVPRSGVVHYNDMLQEFDRHEEGDILNESNLNELNNDNQKGPLFDGVNLKESPLKLINDIDERLFPTKALSEKDKIAQQQRPFIVARVNFLQFYEKNKQLCHKLVREFLVRSHFWIIPGGIKEIDESYAHQHLFITSVFTIIGMSFDDNEKYTEKQEVLYPLVERFLTNTLTMFEELTDFDIEAILYCCMFHISKKSRRHRQLKFNSLVLSNFAIYSMLNVIDFHKLKERVLVKEEYNSKDLYHLRILNSLTACNIEYSISYGNVSPQDKMLMEYNNLTAKFPQANFGDDIKISEINLGDTVNSIFLNFRSYYKTIKQTFIDESSSNSEIEGQNMETELIIFPELDYWLKNWEELLSKDGAGILLFTFDFYHIMICRSFISEFLKNMQTLPRFLSSTLLTMKEHSFSLLNGFLRLPPSLIRGAPIFTTHEIVYTCLTLCDFLHWFDPEERQHVLNICSRVYWHLNTIGEKMNDATDNVGKIIKSIIDTSKRRASLANFPMPMSHLSNINRNNDQTSSKSLKNVAHEYNGAASPGSTHSYTSRASTVDQAPAGSIMPDVDQFDTFEDFFQDFIGNLKPTSQRMFSAAKSK